MVERWRKIEAVWNKAVKFYGWWFRLGNQQATERCVEGQEKGSMQEASKFVD